MFKIFIPVGTVSILVFLHSINVHEENLQVYLLSDECLVQVVKSCGYSSEMKAKKMFEDGNAV